jgi:hypothetical protein
VGHRTTKRDNFYLIAALMTRDSFRLPTACRFLREIDLFVGMNRLFGAAGSTFHTIAAIATLTFFLALRKEPTANVQLPVRVRG